MAAVPSDEIRKAVARLRRRPEVRALARVARRHGIPVWLVGGAVRDAVLGLPVPEVDAAVGRDPEELARSLEREGLGTAVFLSKDRPGPRVFRVAGRRPLDIAEIEGGSIDADLARRDFTVNAIAVDLEDGRILDPFGGLADLSRRRLRCVRARNLAEDPLRALRAARFLATHGLSPDAATLAAARAVAAELPHAARERIAGELAKLLEAPEAGPAFAWAARAGLLPAVLGLPLSPSESARAARALEPLDGRSARGLSPERRRRLRVARLASRLRLPHGDAGRWLRALRLPRRDVEPILRLAGLVGSAPTVRDRRGAVAWRLAAGELAPDALLLLGLDGADSSEARRARRLGLASRTPLGRVRVTGDDIVRWLSLAPGPRIGNLLEGLRLEAALGTVRNRREARHWLTGQARDRP